MLSLDIVAKSNLTVQSQKANLFLKGPEYNAPRK